MSAAVKVSDASVRSWPKIASYQGSLGVRLREINRPKNKD
jgi:hypothetical protein